MHATYKTTLYWLIFVGIILICALYTLRKYNQTYETFADSGDPIVTFIIPTIGRPTIDIPLQGLLNLKNPNWKAIVVYDGEKTASPTISDPRISILRAEKQGNAGAVRNIGIQQATTEWVAFVDDDDILRPDYIDRMLETEENYGGIDVIVFRYANIGYEWYSKHQVVPPCSTRDTLTQYQVGISFCVRKRVYKQIKFQAIKYAEDFQYLEDAVKQGFKIVLSKHATYAARLTQTDIKRPNFWKDIEAIQCEESIIKSTNRA